MNFKICFYLTNLSFLIFLAACSGGGEKKSSTEAVKDSTTVGRIERLDPGLDAILDTSSGIEVLAGGFEWTEGPLWIQNGDYLLFSDIPPNKIFRWDGNNGLKEYLHPSGYTGNIPRGGEPGSNGLLLDAQGRLVLCQHGDRRMARMDAPLEQPAPKFITLTDRFEGKRLNSPNDAVYRKNGDLYFTDPPYGLLKNVDDSSKEISFQGVYRLKPDGKLDLVTSELSRPNGIAFSPDESILYIANSDGARKIWMAYQIGPDGLATSGKIFYDATAVNEPGGPDGMKVDYQGNIFATGPGGVWIFDQAGKVLGKIRTGQLNSNCAFNADQTELYITADDYLMRVKLKKR